MTAVGGTPPRWTTTGPMTSGLPATSSPPGRNASGTTATTALGMTATATGSGRIAPNSTTRATTALMTAVGGTLQASMTTGPMTGGSPVMNSPPGKSAEGATPSNVMDFIPRRLTGATTSGSGPTGTTPGGETHANVRAGPTAAGSTGTMPTSLNTGTPATSTTNGTPSGEQPARPEKTAHPGQLPASGNAASRRTPVRNELARPETIY